MTRDTDSISRPLWDRHDWLQAEIGLDARQ